MVEEALKKSIRILMLEDSSLDAELATERLRRADLDAEVTLARNRREFEEALLARPYDLVLADYALPDFDGIAALAQVRDSLPHTPFIFISGRVGEEVAIDTLQRGATDYVLKHRLERLVPAVLRAFKESAEHRTRMQAEAMFRQSELRFRHVIDAVPQMIWVANAEGKLAYRNQVWVDTVTADVSHWCDPALFHPEDYPACLASWRQALIKREPFTLELRILRRSDRTYRWHLVRMTPMAAGAQNEGLNEDENEINWLGTATDVQDQKLNEEALRTAEKLSVAGRLAASIAHEINNPLESLTNLLYLIRLDAEGNERALSFISMMEYEIERMSSITRQTLEFYRDPSVPVDVDTQMILDEVLRLFATKLRSKGVAFTVEVPEKIVFQGIKGEIRQVLINLVNNAIDAVSPEGCIAVEAGLTKHHGQPAVMLQVRDNGSGITAEQAQRLFQPFFSTKGAHGTGLGLWVSKGIVEKHGGVLTLTSTPPTGIPGSGETKATVIVPLAASVELESAHSASAKL